MNVCVYTLFTMPVLEKRVLYLIAHVHSLAFKINVREMMSCAFSFDSRSGQYSQENSRRFLCTTAKWRSSVQLRRNLWLSKELIYNNYGITYNSGRQPAARELKAQSSGPDSIPPILFIHYIIIQVRPAQMLFCTMWITSANRLPTADVEKKIMRFNLKLYLCFQIICSLVY